MGKKKTHSFHISRAVVALTLAAGVASGSAAQMSASLLGNCSPSWSWIRLPSWVCEKPTAKTTASVIDGTLADVSGGQATTTDAQCNVYDVSDGFGKLTPEDSSVTVHKGGVVFKTPNCGTDLWVNGIKITPGKSVNQRDFHITMTDDGFVVTPLKLTSPDALSIQVAGFPASVYLQKGEDLESFNPVVLPEYPNVPKFNVGVETTTTTIDTNGETTTSTVTEQALNAAQAATAAMAAITEQANQATVDSFCLSGAPHPWFVCPQVTGVMGAVAGFVPSPSVPGLVQLLPSVTTLTPGYHFDWSGTPLENAERLLQLTQGNAGTNQGSQITGGTNAMQGSYTWPMPATTAGSNGTPTPYMNTGTQGTNAAIGTNTWTMTSTTTANPMNGASNAAPTPVLIDNKIGVPVSTPNPSIYPIGASNVSAGHAAATDQCHDTTPAGVPIDNDGNGLANGFDPGCQNPANTSGFEDSCWDRIDNFNDGFTDAFAASCANRNDNNALHQELRQDNMHGAATDLPTGIIPIHTDIQYPPSLAPVLY